MELGSSDSVPTLDAPAFAHQQIGVLEGLVPTVAGSPRLHYPASAKPTRRGSARVLP